MESIRSPLHIWFTCTLGYLIFPVAANLSSFFTLVSIVVQVKLESKLFISIIIICGLSVLISVSFQIRAIELTILTFMTNGGLIRKFFVHADDLVLLFDY